MLINETLKLTGAIGVIDCLVEWPDCEIKGWSLILHPHPLYGGSRDNKVVTTISRECLKNGIVAVKPNFRGVGKSDGSFDMGVGETEDMRMVVDQIIALYPKLLNYPSYFIGFSFGSAVAAQLYSLLYENNKLSNAMYLILVGSAVQRFQFRDLYLSENIMIIHGESDEVVPFNEMLDWARPRQIPIIIIPDCSHFFHGKLLLLRKMISIYLKSSII